MQRATVNWGGSSSSSEKGSRRKLRSLQDTALLKARRLGQLIISPVTVLKANAQAQPAILCLLLTSCLGYTWHRPFATQDTD